MLKATPERVPKITITSFFGGTYLPHELFIYRKYMLFEGEDSRRVLKFG
jgi:hypothetical protein